MAAHHQTATAPFAGQLIVSGLDIPMTREERKAFEANCNRLPIVCHIGAALDLFDPVAVQVHTLAYRFMITSALTAAAWIYAGALLLWFGLSSFYGDHIWWLALLNATAPLLFLPVPCFLVALATFPSRRLGLALVPPILVFSIVYGPLLWPKWRAAPVAADRTFTIMTFNIWWSSEAPANGRVPAQNGFPDIVALQELQPHIAKYLLREVGTSYPYHLFDFEGEEPQQLGVLSRYPLTALDVRALAERDFRVQLVRVSLPEGPILLYNIHPRATNIRRYLREDGGVRAKVQQSFVARQKATARMLADIARRQEPVVVVGDMNSTPRNHVYTMMRAHLADAHRSVGWGFGHTFPVHRHDLGWLPVPNRSMRLDMIFHSQALVAHTCRVGTAHGESDHLPVIATLGWRQ